MPQLRVPQASSAEPSTDLIQLGAESFETNQLIKPEEVDLPPKPDRGLAGDALSERVRKYRGSKGSAEQIDKDIKISEENLTMVTQAIANNLSTADKIVLNVATTPIALAEDIYNTGVDIINFASNKLGGGDLLDTSNVVSRFLPTDTGSEISREIGKFLIGYGAAVKGVRAMRMPQTKVGLKGTEIAAGMMADFVVVKPEQDTLLQGLLKKLPIGETVTEYLTHDGDESNLEGRLKNSLFGVVEGQMAEALFKTIKHMKLVRKAEEIAELPPVITTEAAEEGAGKAVKEAVDELPPELPPVPTLDELIPSIKDTTYEKVIKNMETEGRSVDILNIVDEETGERIFMNVGNIKDDDMKKFIMGVTTAESDRFARTAKNLSDIEDLAVKNGMLPDEFMKWTADMGLKPGQILAGQKFATAVSSSTINIMKRFKLGDATREEAVLALAKATEVHRVANDMTSLSGLMLREKGFDIDPSKLKADKYLRQLTDIYGDDVDAISRVLDGWEVSDRAFGDVLRTAVWAPMGDRLTQIRYSSMLSNPATHLRNIYGGIQTTLTRPGETLLAATINSIQKNPHGVHFSDAYHEMMGIAQGTLEAMSIAGQKMRGNNPRTFLGVDKNKAKLPQFASQNLTEPKSTMGKGLKFVDEHVVQGKFVGQALQFEDNIMKHVNARMTLNREAYRKGFLEGTERGASKEEVALIIKNELEAPSDKTLKMMFNDAEYNTFTNDVEGSILQSLETFSRTPVGRLIAPFAKVNLNSMTYKLERIPGVNLILDKTRKEWNSGDPAIRQRILAKMSFMSTTMGGLAMWLHGQDAITGSGPKDSGKWKIYEQAGLQQGSIKVGDSWIEYRRETPMGAIMGVVADLAELQDLADGDNDQFIQDAHLAYMAVIGELFTPEYLVDTTGKLFEAMAKGDTSSAEKILRVGVGIGETFLPYAGLARQIQRQMTVEGRIKRESFNPSSILETMSANILNIYAPDRLAVKRNILGHPMMHKQGLGPDLVSPFGVTDETENPVIQELAKLSGANYVVNPKFRIAGRDDLSLDSDYINISMPPKVMTREIGGRTQSIKLGLADYEELVQAMAGIHPKIKEGNDLEKSLSIFFKSKMYEELPFREQGLMTKVIINKYRELGRQIFLGNDQYVGKLEETANAIAKKYKSSKKKK